MRRPSAKMLRRSVRRPKANAHRLIGSRTWRTWRSRSGKPNAPTELPGRLTQMELPSADSGERCQRGFRVVAGEFTELAVA